MYKYNHIIQYVSTQIQYTHCMNLKLMFKDCFVLVWQLVVKLVDLDPHAGGRDAGVPTDYQLLNGIMDEDVLILM